MEERSVGQVVREAQLSRTILSRGARERASGCHLGLKWQATQDRCRNICQENKEQGKAGEAEGRLTREGSAPSHQ